MVNVAYTNFLVLFLIHFIFFEIFLQGVKCMYVEISLVLSLVESSSLSLHIKSFLINNKICLEKKDPIGKSTIPSFTYIPGTVYM